MDDTTFSHKKIAFAAQDSVDALAPYVTQILAAIKVVCGISVSFISDESCLSDFCINKDDVQELSEFLGFPVDLDEHNYIIVLAQNLKKKASA